MKQYRLRLAALALLTAATVSFAQSHDHHAGHGSTSDNVVVKAFEDASAKMHKDMTVELTGDADVDFVRGMIPHHQGAIDMAKIELEHGKDPEIRKLAEEVIAAQEKEIEQMKAWLKSKGH
jgi:uncharacterized protein (DUF305 family)